MNKDRIVENMVDFIQKEERNLQVSKMSTDTKAAKSDIVNAILEHLEEELQNEN
ncbi:hypothetical protein [Butyrivibrio sp.]|uniref:hypothetical protein n=1 Tax=Butyrivibrio sp. TaxID=28121 RepID=UPI0025BF526E|nr:hypothetical protein [Butyrivibrio sp.]